MNISNDTATMVVLGCAIICMVAFGFVTILHCIERHRDKGKKP